MINTTFLGFCFLLISSVLFKCPHVFSALDIERWNLECEFNNTDHRTDLNGVDRLILRRGQVFTISLYLRSGTFQPGVSSLEFVAETGATTTLPLYFYIFLYTYKFK